MDGAVFVTLNRHHSQFKGDKREGPVLRWDEGGRRLVGLYRTLYHQNVSMLAVCRTYIFLLKKIGRISDHNSLAGQVRVADVVCNNIEKTYFSVLCAERANRERPRLYRDTTGCC